MKNQNQCAVYYCTFHTPIQSHAIQKKIALQILQDAFRSFFHTTLQEALIKRAPSGKPYYESPGNYFFSISHCTKAIAVAVAHTPVGVDTESVRPVNPSTVKKCCSPAEAKYVFESIQPKTTEKGVLSEAETKRFLNLWTLKESYVKMTGEGLRTPLNTICFNIPGFQKISPNTLQCIHPNEYCSYLYTQPNCTISLTLQQKPTTTAPQIQWLPCKNDKYSLYTDSIE